MLKEWRPRIPAGKSRDAHKRSLIFVAAILASGAPLQAAISVGYFTDITPSDTGPAAPIAANGFTPVQITNIATFNLNSISVLLIDEPNNGSPSAALLGQATALSNWVAGGGVIAIHDRNVCLGTCTPVPGSAGIVFTRLTGANIDVEPLTTLVTNGRFGTIGNTTLDGGNFSDHGFSGFATLPSGAAGILNNGTPGNEVAFSYCLGAGAVYYSTIPLDFYLAGGNPAPFRTVYAPNLVAYLGSLVGSNCHTALVAPAPAQVTAGAIGAPTLSEWGLGILAVMLLGCAAVMLRSSPAGRVSR
jgi:hypothetical protein